MKKKLLLLAILILIPFKITFAQSAVLVGPVTIDSEYSLQIGYAQKFFGFHLVGFGNFGETTEAAAEAIKLFPLIGGLHAGPIAGIGADWSDAQGTGGEAVKATFFKAAGVGATYLLNDRFGCWGFYKSRIENEFQGKFGFGILYRI